MQICEESLSLWSGVMLFRPASTTRLYGRTCTDVRLAIAQATFIMASQILTRGQLKKLSNENLIASFVALQDNIILQQNDLLQQNRDISKKLLEITPKTDSLAKSNEELKSDVSVAQNASKILQEAFKTTNSKLVARA